MCFECLAAAKLATCFSDIGDSAVATGHNYEIFNMRVGRDCLTALLGISHHRLRKALTGEVDLRYSIP
eukprot:11021860-Alexandrium_andersonii.AAC.1